MPRSGLNASLMKPLVVLAFPGMYLVYKISEFKRQQQEHNRRKVTERELAHLNHKIVSRLFWFSLLLEGDVSFEEPHGERYDVGVSLRFKSQLPKGKTSN